MDAAKEPREKGGLLHYRWTMTMLYGVLTHRL